MGIGLESVMSAINENGERFVQCPTPNCQNGAIVPDHVLKFECNECGQKWCPKCKRSYHHNETCKEYADRKALEEQMNDAQLRVLAEQNGWRQCPTPQCQAFIERT